MALFCRTLHINEHSVIDVNLRLIRVMYKGSTEYAGDTSASIFPPKKPPTQLLLRPQNGSK